MNIRVAAGDRHQVWVHTVVACGHVRPQLGIGAHPQEWGSGVQLAGFAASLPCKGDRPFFVVARHRSKSKKTCIPHHRDEPDQSRAKARGGRFRSGCTPSGFRRATNIVTSCSVSDDQQNQKGPPWVWSGKRRGGYLAVPSDQATLFTRPPIAEEASPRMDAESCTGCAM